MYKVNIIESEREKESWTREELVKFIMNEDYHTEGETGDSCISVKTLMNFIEQNL